MHRLYQLLCGSVVAMTALLAGAQAAAEDVSGAVTKIQHDWAVANYQLNDKAQLEAFEQLIHECERYAQAYPDAAEIWTWSGIVKSSYAGAKGGLGALSLAKASRKDLERAIELNGKALDGSAYTSLATLYAQVPGWPLGFGSEEKAAKLFQQALALNPKGIDPNYFYAQFLFDQGHYAEAEKYYLIAQGAPARPNRPLADAGRQREILAGLSQTREKLAH